MLTRKSLLVGFTVCSLLLAVCFSAHASMALTARSFTSLVAYGDSLSDDGNTGAFPLGDGANRFTDQEIWVELLAGQTGSKLYSVAYGGATTGLDNQTVPSGDNRYGLQWQVGAFQPYFSHNLDMDDTLFTVWAGANDFFQQRGYEQAANNIGTAIQSLADSGARNIIVPNLPNLGNTPLFYGQTSQATASLWSSAFNADLASELMAFQKSNPDVNLYYLDTHSIFGDLLEYDADGKIVNFGELFFDPVHPTIVGHEALAAAAIEVLNPVPLPATLILMGSGLLGLGALRRKFK